jgi:hypothetical protein
MRTVVPSITEPIIEENCGLGQHETIMDLNETRARVFWRVNIKPPQPLAGESKYNSSIDNHAIVVISMSEDTVKDIVGKIHQGINLA